MKTLGYKLIVWTVLDIAIINYIVNGAALSVGKIPNQPVPAAAAVPKQGVVSTYKTMDNTVAAPPQIILSTNSPYLSQSTAAITKAIRWLVEFGYMLRPTANIKSGRTIAAFRRAITKMQQYAKIPATGLLDDATLRKMSTTRCGQSDFITDGRRHRRFILVSRRWPRSQEIDVQFANYTKDLSIAAQEAVMQWAVDEWADAADIRLTFHPFGSHIASPEIKIYHTRYDALGQPFKRYGVLAYAALPTNGDMFFDDTEIWAEYHRTKPQRFSYRTVSLHELGHSLGFAHSDVPSAVMYAFYGPTRHQLTPDDIAGAEHMFGPA